MSGGKVFISLALAISVGILAVIATTLYLEQRAAVTQPVGVAPPPPIPTRDVVVAAKPVGAQTVLDASHLKKVAVPLYKLPPNHFLDFADLIGRRLSSNVAADQPLVADSLFSLEREQANRELAENLPTGFRAIALSVSPVGGVAGFVLPGNKVDVLLSASRPNGGAFSRVIVQDIEVLAVAQDRWVEDRSRPRQAGLVTLKVTPQQAELLEMARSAGTLSFALRAQSDQSISTTLGSRQEDLNGSKPAVEIIRGSARSFE